MEKTNSQILEEWVEDYSDYLLNFALFKINDRDLALDLIQDTYLSALKNVDGFKGESSPKTWLTSILNRKIIDHWRKQNSRKTKVVSQFGSSEEEGSWIVDKGDLASNDGEAEILLNENQMILQDCISKLPEQWQGVLTAKYFEQKKGEEISKEFDLSSSNVWVIVHRAKSALRDCLGTNWF